MYCINYLYNFFDLLRPDMYIEEVKSGICDGKAFPTILKETPATAFIQGNNAIGMVQSCSSLTARSVTLD